MANRDTMDAEIGGDVVFAHTSQLDKIINLARANSLHYLLFGLACCGIELMQTGGPRADLDRFGAVFRATPAPGRLHDRGRHPHLQDGRAAEAALRPDGRAQVRHLHGQLRQLRRPLPARLLGLQGQWTRSSPWTSTSPAARPGPRR